MWYISQNVDSGRIRRVFRHEGREGTWLAWPGGVSGPESVAVAVASSDNLGRDETLTRSPHVCAPMTSRVVLIDVEVGQVIAAGTLVAVVEAMKMEYPLVTQISGRVASIRYETQDKVQRGDVIVTIDPSPPANTTPAGANS